MQGLSFTGRGRLPLIRQSEAAECGLACLAMIAGHYGHRSDLLSLRKHYDVSLKGMTLHDVVRLAHKLKLSTRAVKGGSSATEGSSPTLEPSARWTLLAGMAVYRLAVWT